MLDAEIVELYWARDESAIKYSDEKYGRYCRNIAINLYEKLTAAKRGGTETMSCLDELGEILPSDQGVEETIDMQQLTWDINAFLGSLNTDSRKIFVKRYWYMTSVKKIAKELSVSESKVKMSLLRTREKLKDYLIKEGYAL